MTIMYFHQKDFLETSFQLPKQLKEFFEDVLGVSSQEAGENACKIEHIISENILSRMEKFSKFFKKHKKILEIYIDESEK